MVKQFDIIKVDLSPIVGREKGNYRPCIVVSNDLVNSATGMYWVMPITGRNVKYPTDIPLKTKNRKITGVIDSLQIRTLDLEERGFTYFDSLQENLKGVVLETIQAHTEQVFNV